MGQIVKFFILLSTSKQSTFFVFFHRIGLTCMVLRILNLEGHQNCMISSKLTSILLLLYLNFFEGKEKVQQNDVKVRIGKMKTKTFFVLFSNARSILELMLCNRNLTKLGKPSEIKSRLVMEVFRKGSDPPPPYFRKLWNP